MKKQFPDVEAKRGAPMGRTSILDNKEATVHVFEVRMVDGDYDDGGAYWGGPAEGEHLFCARSDAGDFLDFGRAKSRAEFCATLAVHFPDIKVIDEFDREAMLVGYLTAALWSSNGEDGEPIDKDHDIDDIINSSVARARGDCAEFILLCMDAGIELNSIPDMDAGSIGHDFWLTRHHHGAGFWDRDLGELGDKLTEIAESFSEINPWVSEAGKVVME